MLNSQFFRNQDKLIPLVIWLILTNISTGVMLYLTNDLNSELIKSNNDFSSSNKKLVEKSISLRCELTLTKIENAKALMALSSEVREKTIEFLHAQTKDACAMAGYNETPEPNFRESAVDKPIKLKKSKKGDRHE